MRLALLLTAALAPAALLPAGEPGGLGTVGDPAAAAPGRSGPAEAAVLFVGDRAITRSRVELQTALYRQANPRFPEEACRRRAMQDIVFGELLRAEAESLSKAGMAISERAVEERWRQMLKEIGGPAELARQRGLSVAALRDLARDRLLGDAFRHELLLRAARPTPAELREFYQSNSEVLRRPEWVRAQAVVINRFLYEGDGSRTPRAGAERRARDVMEQLAAGGDFARLAAKYSEDAASAAEGGRLGDVRKDFRIERGAFEAEVEKALFSASPGAPAILVEGRTAFYVLQVLRRFPAGVPPFEEVEREVFERCFLERVRQAEEKFFRESFAKVLVRDAAGRRLGADDFLAAPSGARKRSLFDRTADEPEPEPERREEVYTPRGQEPPPGPPPEPKSSDRTDPSDHPEPAKPAPAAPGRLF
ncbi:MAG TPA: peptidylprolyl isomerase [Planctomycetota bacterium]|nr:peptidylprolyl isomerase [Planctomycetota bacterium]